MDCVCFPIGTIFTLNRFCGPERTLEGACKAIGHSNCKLPLLIQVLAAFRVVVYHTVFRSLMYLFFTGNNIVCQCLLIHFTSQPNYWHPKKIPILCQIETISQRGYPLHLPPTSPPILWEFIIDCNASSLLIKSSWLFHAIYNLLSRDFKSFQLSNNLFQVVMSLAQGGWISFSHLGGSATNPLLSRHK